MINRCFIALLCTDDNNVVVDLWSRGLKEDSKESKLVMHAKSIQELTDKELILR